MSCVRVLDAGGEGANLIELDGYRVAPANNAEVTRAILENMPNLKCREDDVFVCAPVKSGTHWIWEVISMLMNGKAETIPKPKGAHMLEFRVEEPDLSTLASPRVLNSHLHVHRLPREAIEKRCKIVFVIRNPKDLAVSFYHHMTGINVFNYNGKWADFLPPFLQGEFEYRSWFEYMWEWEKFISDHPDYPLHLVYFEDLKENNLAEVERLGRFLGVANTDGLYEAVSDKCQFKHMQKDKHFQHNIKEVFKEGFSMFRKGEIGDWKNWFTVAQAEYFDKVYKEKMKGSTFKFRYAPSTS